MKTPISNALTLFSLVLGGCFSSPTTVNLVQPGAIAKAALDGEFFWINTVTDVPYGSAATFVGAESNLERIHWSVEEDWLIGYRSYENVVNTDENADATQYEGAPLLMYRIEKQFDIRRNYNPATGEEGNVIQENMERPWNEREYLRVDWSRNHVDTAWTVAGVRLKAAEYAASDPSDTNAPRFNDSDGDGQLDYFSFTTEVLAQPDTRFLPRYGNIPVCLFYGRAQFECAASEIQIRSSFMRVDNTHEYDGLVYNDKWMDTFGYFSTERLHYDRHYGLTESGRVRYANRHNLWKESWVKNDYGAILCRAGDVQRPCANFTAEDNPKPLAIRYQDRDVRPVVFHVSTDFPDHYRQKLAQIEAEWNEPLKDTVNELRFWECIEEGGSTETCEAVKEDELEVFVLCKNNPSLESDPAVCNTDHTGPDNRPDGIPDTVEMGDLRYSLLGLVDAPHLRSPLGYGPSAVDPKGQEIALQGTDTLSTGAGEIRTGSAMIYTYGLDRLAEQLTDMVLLLNGDLSPEEFAEGENVEDWVNSLRDGGEADYGRTWGRDKEIQDALDKMQTRWARIPRSKFNNELPSSAEEIVAWHGAMDNAISQSGVFGGGALAARENWENLAESEFVHNGWDAETLHMLGFHDHDSNPMALIDPAELEAEDAGLVMAGQHAVDFMEDGYSNPNLIGLAERFRIDDADEQTIYNTIRNEMFAAVTLHEIGHTMGLRHNFAGSFDAFNFHPEYWELRDDGDMGPRHIDPETEAERLGGIRGYQYSSVMDYQAVDVTEWHGLGKYDKAAIKFGYGKLVEVLKSVRSEKAMPPFNNLVLIDSMNWYSSSRSLPAPLIGYTGQPIHSIHYTLSPRIADLESRVNVPLDFITDGQEDTSFQRTMRTPRSVPGLIHQDAPLVPYRFCSDEFATGMNCDRWDQGADFYEIQEAIQTRYFAEYALNNLRRNRYGFGNTSAYLSRQYRNVFRPLQNFMVHYSLYHGMWGVDENPRWKTLFAGDNSYGNWTLSTLKGFDFMTQVILRPEPGSYRPGQDDEGNPLLTFNGFDEDNITVPLGTGAWYDSDWDHESGYFWFDQQRVIGVHWDKMLALQTLTNSSAGRFVGMDTAADPRRFAIGYNDLFEEPLTLFLGRLNAGEIGQIAPALTPDGQLRYPDFTDFGTTWPPEELDALEPGAHWLLQYNAGLYGKALLQRGYDTSFLRKSRLYLRGHGTEVTPPEDVEEVEFLHPTTGDTYVAWSFSDDQGLELGPAARMLNKGNRLHELCDAEASDDSLVCDQLRLFSQDIDSQYRMYQYFGTN